MTPRSQARAAALSFTTLVLVSLPWAAPASAQLFRRPVACDNCIWDYYYYDHGSFRVQDYNCSGSTYGGHVGTDYSLRGNNNGIEGGHDVVAAAAGTVISTEDGYYDRCTQCGGAQCGYSFGNGFGNQVYIDHGSYRAMYGHMRTGSIAVQAGERVECGQRIGQIGSSGCSTGAHVHFEPQNSQRRAVDPFEGSCSPTPTSLWVDQGSHRGLPGTGCDGGEPPPPACPADTYAIWTCNQALTERRRCISGVDTIEPCAYGCQAMAPGTDDICALPPDADGDGSRADVDCDDGNAQIHPGAVDICGDGVDQDCSGADAVCAQPPMTGAAGTTAGASAGGGPVGGVAGASAGTNADWPSAGQWVPVAGTGLAGTGLAGTGLAGTGLAGAGGASGQGAAGATGVGTMDFGLSRAPAQEDGCRVVAAGAVAPGRVPIHAIAMSLAALVLALRKRGPRAVRACRSRRTGSI